MYLQGKSSQKIRVWCKVSVATTNRDNFVAGMQALPGNLYDGHALQGTLEQVARLTGQHPQRCYVDRGYRGHGVTDTAVFISGQRRNVTPNIRKELRRRSAIEPVIGQMEEDGKLNRNWLKGISGDKINALLCGAGHNIRIILRRLGGVLFFFVYFTVIEQLWKKRADRSFRIVATGHC